MTHRFSRTAARPVLLGLIAGFAIAAAAEEAHIVATPGSAKWGDAPPNLPKGGQLAVLHGDPGKAEMFSVMLKMPAGYKIPAHWHSQDENLVIISGALYAGMGDKLDMKKAQALKPGAYVYMPAKMHHYAFAKAPTVIELHGMGPFDITYIDPADDPTKKK
jgi:quercetin dioxygenase-like cupin family protein